MICLDVWAGDTLFWRKLQSANPEIKLVLCAEPKWKEDFSDIFGDHPSFLQIYHGMRTRLFTVLETEKIKEVINKQKRWVHRITGWYEDMVGIPDNSLDMITINSPQPLCPPQKNFDNEVYRTLKSWWILYYSHTDMKYIPKWIEEVLWKPILSRRFNGNAWKHDTIEINGKTFSFPKSTIVAWNIIKISYIFHGEINPGVKVWIKP